MAEWDIFYQKARCHDKPSAYTAVPFGSMTQIPEPICASHWSNLVAVSLLLCYQPFLVAVGLTLWFEFTYEVVNSPLRICSLYVRMDCIPWTLLISGCCKWFYALDTQFFCRQGPFGAHVEWRHQPLGYLCPWVLYVFLGQRSPLGHWQHPFDPFLPPVAIIPQCPEWDKPLPEWTNNKPFAPGSISILTTSLFFSF